VRMIRANNNHVDTVEREKEEHEKQYEDKKVDPRSIGRRTSSSSSVGSNATSENLNEQRKPTGVSILSNFRICSIIIQHGALAGNLDGSRLKLKISSAGSMRSLS